MGAGPISNHIRRLRFEHREMTQQALAERIGVTRQTVNAIELGKYSPRSSRVSHRRGVRTPLEAVFQFREPVSPRRRG